ncbi:MAG: alcohol dehydrogenase catalytic domain-containing protein [Planctomycetes bacterium]|nr:alcohol dehydrogenase catalytic domain-containing protein [Planctomycetota bacterium]
MSIILVMEIHGNTPEYFYNIEIILMFEGSIMQAAFRNGKKTFIRDVQLGPLAEGEVRVQVSACGVCGTDLHENPAETGKDLPFGHEIAGVIRELGPGVSGLKIGQAVALDSSTACGVCESCRNTEQELCQNQKGFWQAESLGMAEEMIAPAISCLPYEGLTPDLACLQEPLGVAIDMIRLSGIGVDSNVLVVGPGAVGLMALALARRAGARRIFLSASPDNKERIRVARAFGADEVIDRKKLLDCDFGCRIDRILVTAPPPAIHDAMAVAAKGGIITFIGIGYGEAAFCRFDVNAFHFKKLQLRASFASPALFGPRALQYLREGVVDGAALISHRFRLAEISQAVTMARDTKQSVKVVVTP